MPDQSHAAPYHTLIHIGCGATPNLTAYGQLAKHGWLIDADQDVINHLETVLATHPTLRCQQSLVGTQEQTGTFYRYSAPWANGLTPIDEATQRLYPGLRCLDSTEQTITPVHTLVEHCLPANDSEPAGQHLLLLEAGQQNEPLLNALEETGQLKRFATVIVLPAHRRALPIPVPPSLHGPVDAPAGLSLPENSQVLKQHPLLEQTQHYQQALAHTEQQLEEAEQARVIARSEATKQSQALEATQKQLTERDQQLEETEQARVIARSEAAKQSQALEATQQQLTERDQRLAEAEQARVIARSEATKQSQALEATQKQLTKRDQQLEEAEQARVIARSEATKQSQALEATQKQLTERDQQLEAAEQARVIARSEATKQSQALEATQKQLTERDQQLAERTQQRDEEWHKGEQLTKERDELKHQLEEAQKQCEEALHQNHQNFQAKTAAEARVAQLEKELEIATQQIQQSRQQLHQEQSHRQQLIEQEMLKAEAQLDLIKDILIQGKEF
ncbi:hypothetical protein [Vreelandella arctica]|uniref:hypothetical protein n=1 Tax=Vreelandella arctica TaxID=3126499 RepID=UPI00300E2035